MRVLILSHRVPFPPNGGYPIVVYNTIKGLLQLGVNITLFSLNTPRYAIDFEDVNDPIFKQIDFHSAQVDVEMNWFSTLFNLFSTEPYHITRFFDDYANQILSNLLKENKYDIIHLEGIFVVSYLDTIKNLSQAKLIYRAHSIEYKVWERLAIREKFTPRRWYLNYLSRRLETFETEQINRFHQVFAISEPDRRNMLMMGCHAPLDVYPVALDLAKYEIDKPRNDFPTLFYIGAMDWQPNVEGLEWFLDEVWPDIEKLSAELRFYVAGKFMPKHFFDYDSENVIVEGEVFDLNEFMDSKTIMIVPLLSGSGMRVRIIEGMAMQKCIIATTNAAEGIRYKNGDNLLIADTVDEFYRAILKCVTQPKLTQVIGENARKLVEEHHNIESTSKWLYKQYQKLLKR
jgi:glycosyltransferase involved in cell wall biosynthesis